MTVRRVGQVSGHRFGRVQRMTDGRYLASYVQPPGVRHTAPTAFASRAQAREWLAERESALRADDLPQASDAAGAGVTFHTFAAAWLDARSGLSDTTRSGHLIALHDHLFPIFGAMPLDRIDEATVQAWLDSWGKRKLSARAHAYSVLSQVMAAAVAQGVIDVNPCPRHRRVRAGNGRPEPASTR